MTGAHLRAAMLAAALLCPGGLHAGAQVYEELAESVRHRMSAALADKAVAELAFRDRLAIGFGVLTCENDEQAWARASVDRKNKGAEVAHAALRMIVLKREFGPA